MLKLYNLLTAGFFAQQTTQNGAASLSVANSNAAGSLLIKLNLEQAKSMCRFLKSIKPTLLNEEKEIARIVYEHFAKAINNKEAVSTLSSLSSDDAKKLSTILISGKAPEELTELLKDALEFDVVRGTEFHFSPA